MSQQDPLTSEFKSKNGIKRLYSAFFYSIDGLKAAWKHEFAFRQELIIIGPGIIVALMLPVSTVEKVLLIAVLMLVLIMELINSAIEAIVDRVSLEWHPLSKNAKDLGSAAVFLTALLAGISWAVILLPLLSALAA